MGYKFLQTVWYDNKPDGDGSTVYNEGTIVGSLRSEGWKAEHIKQAVSDGLIVHIADTTPQATPQGSPDEGADIDG